MSLVYNNKKLIGKCSKFAIEKVQGTSPFVMLENFEPKQPQLNENQKSIEEYVEMAIVQLREANLILNKVYEKDRFAREIQDDISEIMGTLRYRYFGEQEEE
ncbi:hypothetical protein ACFC9G_13365 [Enterococcus casseliflavus]|uniref:hypothetical protein n=1 Tax=Enterococcus casseliflavus TaxID=37734 RepID=UPI0039A77ACF